MNHQVLLGNHVYGNGELPNWNNESDEHVQQTMKCNICMTEVPQSEMVYIKTIDKFVHGKCINDQQNESPADQLWYFHHIANINPFNNPDICLKLNEELLSKHLLKLPYYDRNKTIR